MNKYDFCISTHVFDNIAAVSFKALWAPELTQKSKNVIQKALVFWWERSGTETASRG
jgi:hypothetical protein